MCTHTHADAQHPTPEHAHVHVTCARQVAAHPNVLERRTREASQTEASGRRNRANSRLAKRYEFIFVAHGDLSIHGLIAQLGERQTEDLKVSSSILD